MSGNKRRLRGQSELGSAIDERLRRRASEAELPETLGAALSAPQSGGGSPGGGGDATDEPAYPEGVVESIAAGEGATPRHGSFELRAGGTLSLGEEAGPGGGGAGSPDWRLLLESQSLLAVAELPAAGDAEILYHLTDDGGGGDGGIWWDAQGDGGWQQLNAPAIWQREDAVIRTVIEGDRLELSAEESPGISRGVLKAEYSGSTLQNSAGKFVASSSEGLVYAIEASCNSDGGCTIRALHAGSGTCVQAFSLEGGFGIDTDRIHVSDYISLFPAAPPAPSAGQLRLWAQAGGLWLREESSGPFALLSRVRLGDPAEAGIGGLGPGGSTAPAELSQPRLALIPGPGIALAAASVDAEDPHDSEAAFTLSAAPLACLAPASTVANSAAETAFDADCILPGAYLAAGSLLRISARGVYSCSNASSSETLRLRLYAGATLLLDSTALTLAPGAAPSGRGWRLDAELICAAAGSSGSLECQGCFSYHPTAGGLSAFDMSSAAPVSLSTIDELELSLSVQWNNALASSSITLRQFVVESFAPPL